MKRRWFFFFFRKSISQRLGRIIIASSSVTLAVAVVTGMIGITAGIREKLGAELKAYGANIIVSAGKGDFLALDSVSAVSSIPGVEEVTGQLLASTTAGGRAVEVIGLDLAILKNRGWRLQGNWPSKEFELLAGVNLKDALGLKAGQVLTLGHEAEGGGMTVTGFIEKGGPEDSAVIMALADAWRLTGSQGRLSTLLVRGKSGRLEEIVAAIRKTIPGALPKTLRQVAVAEESLLRKIQLLMALVTAVVVFATAISVASTMGANVLERREEIGLMKALGATRWEISLFYRAEAALIGLAGGGAGFALGFASAQVVSRGAFHSFITMPWYLALFSLAAGLAISMTSSHFPVRDAMRYSPAVILRGE